MCKYKDVFIKYVYRRYKGKKKKKYNQMHINFLLAKNIMILPHICYFVIILFWIKTENIRLKNLISFDQ